MKYGITAATGHFGQAAVAALNELVGADQVVVIARIRRRPSNFFRSMKSVTVTMVNRPV